MKRIVSIFLLLLTLAASVQPTLALHFCGGRLHSVRLGGDAEMSCCKSAKKHVTDCADKHDATLPQNGFILFKSVNSCCSNYNIELSTDTFQQQQEITTDIYPVVTFLPYFLPDFLLPHQASDSPGLHNLPPGIPAPHTADVLTQFCIFRI